MPAPVYTGFTGTEANADLDVLAAAIAAANAVAAGAIQKWPAEAYEIGVVDESYKWNDARRFGVDPTGATESTTQFQNALASMRAGASWIKNGIVGSLKVGNGQYLVTKSLNNTSDNTDGHGTGIIGEGSLNTIFLSALTEAYPVIDCVGNGNMRLQGFSIRQQAGCLATAGIFMAYTGADTVGIEPQLDDLLVIMTDCPGIINRVDLAEFFRVRAYGTFGCISGGYDPTGCTSKYKVLFGSTGDMTQTRMYSCGFLGGTPLLLTGCANYLAVGLGLTCLYAAGPSPVDACLVIDQSNTIGSNTQAIVIRGIRTENQTPAGTRDVIHAVAVLSASYPTNYTEIPLLDIQGPLEVANLSGPNAASTLVYSDAHSLIQKLRLRIASSYPAVTPTLELHGNDFSCSVSEIDIQQYFGQKIGTVANKALGARIEGQFPLSEVTNVVIPGGRIEYRIGTGLSTPAINAGDYAMVAGAPSLTAAQVASLAVPYSFADQSYVGGSGNKDVIIFALPKGLGFTEGRVQRVLDIESWGNIVAGTTISIVVTDGVHTATVGGWAVLPGACTLKVRLQRQSHGSVNVIATLTLDNVAPRTASGSVAIDEATDFTVALRVNGANNDPTQINVQPAGIWR